MSIEVRNFDLMNSEGKAYTLTVSNKYTGFLGEVDGLGYEKSSEYQKIGNEYVQLTDSINQAVINGVIRFFQPHAYQEFTAFAEYCQDKDLTLYYRIPTGLFLRKGSITKIDKSEGNNSLQVKVAFTAKSLWYREIKEEIEDNSLGVLSRSKIDSLCCLSFSGVTKSNANLSWSQEVDGVEVMTGTLKNVTIAATDTVFIRTDTKEYQIYKVSSGGTKTNLYDKSDFGTGRFPFFYKGENEFIVTGATMIRVEGRELYETV